MAIIPVLLVSLFLASPARAAIAHRATSTAENGSGATTITISPPSGTVYGDLLVLVLSTRDGSQFTGTPSGWTRQVTTGNGSPAIDLFIYTKIAGSGESNLTITLSSSTKAAAIMSAYTGVDIYDPVDVMNTATNTTASTTYSVGTMTTSQPNTMLVAAFAAPIGGTVTAGGGMTLTGQATSSGGGSGATKVTLGVQVVAQATAAATGTKTMTGPNATNVGFLMALRPAVAVEQASYRFFQNANSTSVTTPLAAIDTPITIESGLPFRLRLNLGVPSGGANATSVAARTFRLQYSTTSDGTCDAGFSGEAYADVDTTSGVKFYDNATPSNGAVYSSNATYDPKRTSINAIAQKYHESNPMSMNTAIASGEDGLWDFALTTSGLNYGKVYCLRVQEGTVNSNIATYTQFPKITIATPAVGQANYRWFANTDSLAPGSPLAAQDTAASIAPQTPVRLRQRLAVNTNQVAASYQNYKLQYAEKSGVCDAGFTGEIYSDVYVPSSTSASMDNGSATNNTAVGTIAWSNPSNGTVDDFSYSTVQTTSASREFSNYLQADNYGFNIPSNATIDGIEVTLKKSGSGNGVGALIYDDEVKLAKNGVIGGTNLAYAFSNWIGGPISTYGGPTVLWGQSWTPADINSSLFGVAVSVNFQGDGTLATFAGLSNFKIKVYYSVPATVTNIGYNDNATPSDAAAISSSGNDPTNGGRTAVYQNYRETDPFTNNAAIPAGQDGMWDFALSSDASVAGKTYCLRVVQSNGTPLSSYSQIPEVTFSGGGGGGGPTVDQKLRGGQSVQNGVKAPFDL